MQLLRLCDDYVALRLDFVITNKDSASLVEMVVKVFAPALCKVDMTVFILMKITASVESFDTRGKFFIFYFYN